MTKLAPLQLEHPDQLPDRRPLDKYRTPDWPTQALIESYPEPRGELFIDPAAGDGRMSRSFMAAGRFDICFNNDIDPTELGLDSYADATRPEFWEPLKLQASYRKVWAVSNVPFLRATEIVWLALQAVGNVAMLLRSTWLEPTEDRQWLGRFPPRAELVLPRFSFIGGAGSDSAGCRWILWGDVEPGIKVWTGKPGQMSLIL